MVKTKKNNRDYCQKTTEKINGVLTPAQLLQSRQIRCKEQENKFKSNSQNNIFYSNFSNEIFLSHSGQVKLDNFDSCLDLVSSDFIVF